MSNIPIVNKYHKIAERVAKEYSNISSVTSVVIGGSLAREFTDNASDIEMYVYYDKEMPSKKQITAILAKLSAKLTRSKNVHWYHEAWGYHTFFKYQGVKFELGYRDIHEINVRIQRFNKTFSLPQQTTHDTPFGHYESGVASCIVECEILYDKDNDLGYLKKYLSNYHTSWIRDETFKYYITDATTLLRVKAQPAAIRDDIYNFNACISRAIRSLTIALFALNDTYYPGDKWNAQYVSRFSKKPKDYEVRINSIFNAKTTTTTEKRQVVSRLLALVRDTKRMGYKVDQ